MSNKAELFIILELQERLKESRTKVKELEARIKVLQKENDEFRSLHFAPIPSLLTIPDIKADGPRKYLDMCEGCKYLQYKDGGHCYMFKEQPKDTCMQYDDGSR